MKDLVMMIVLSNNLCIFLILQIFQNKSISVYENLETTDARINDDLDTELKKVYEIEEKTRIDNNIKLEDIVTMLYGIENLYWRSLASVIATYNFRKIGRPQEELNVLKFYVTNEFNSLIEDWNEKDWKK